MTNPIVGFVSTALQSPLAAIMQATNEIIGKFVADPNAKLQLQRELAEAEQAFRMKMLDADMNLAQQQAQTIMAEAKSDSWLARNWRPMLMLTFTFVVAWNFIVAPLFHVGKTDIPPDMWDLLKLGITGYIVGRSAEKIAPAVADAITSKHDA